MLILLAMFCLTIYHHFGLQTVMIGPWYHLKHLQISIIVWSVCRNNTPVSNHRNICILELMMFPSNDMHYFNGVFEVDSTQHFIKKSIFVGGKKIMVKYIAKVLIFQFNL